jgi:hypothetical protein
MEEVIELEARLHEIELRILGVEKIRSNNENNQTRQIKFSSETNLIQQLNTLQKNFNKLCSLNFKSMLKKIEDVDIHEMESFIEEINNSDDESCEDELFFMLSKREKMRLIINDTDMIERLCSQLDSLEKLIPIMDSNVYNNVQNSRLKDLIPLQTLHKEVEIRTIALFNRIQELIESYNNTMMLLSEKFVYWDRLLTICEKKVDKLLSKQTFVEEVVSPRNFVQLTEPINLKENYF